MKDLIYRQFNLIKLFCCILIVYQHAISSFLISSNANISTHIVYGGILNFSRFAVTIFMVITGFLIIRYEKIGIRNF